MLNEARNRTSSLRLNCRAANRQTPPPPDLTGLNRPSTREQDVGQLACGHDPPVPFDFRSDRCSKACHRSFLGPALPGAPDELTDARSGDSRRHRDIRLRWPFTFESSRPIIKAKDQSKNPGFTASLCRPFWNQSIDDKVDPLHGRFSLGQAGFWNGNTLRRGSKIRKALAYPLHEVPELPASLVANSAHRPDGRRRGLQQIQHGELALRADGTILGLRVSYVDVAGAYTPFGIVTSNMTAMRAVGPYRIRDYEYRYRVVYAHKAGLAPYRGAGQPQGVYLIERLVDRAARELGVDPAELRLRNMITAAEQPWDTGLRRDDRPLVYDGGDYPRAFRRALDLVGHAGFAGEQARLRAGGRYIGLGVVPGIEVGSIGPPEAARVAIDRDGHVTVWAGGASIGQGLETVLTQVCADALGVRPERITVLLGDTAQLTSGGGSFASRGAVAAGNAVATAAARVRERALTIAAHVLEAAPADLEITDGRVAVRGAREGAISLGTLVEVMSQPILGAGRPWPATRPLPWDDTLGLEASAVHRPDFTYSYAVHAAVVEVDVATGVVDVLRYVVVHDCGKVLNPAIVGGQVTGGVAQGLGGALFEEIIHDGAGQNLSSTLMSYVLPRASQVPAITLDHLETPAANPLGVKGAGEGGVMPVAAAISAAVDDALAPWRTFCARTPLTPERVWTMIQAAARVNRRTKRAERGMRSPTARGRWCG